MAVRYCAWIGLDRASLCRVGPGDRVAADAAFGAVVLTVCAAALDRGATHVAAAALAVAAYAATPPQLEALLAAATYAWLAAGSTVTETHLYGVLIGAVATDTSTLWLAVLTAMVAAMAVVDKALGITFGLSLVVVAAVAWILLARPTRKVARVADQVQPEAPPPDRSGLLM